MSFFSQAINRINSTVGPLAERVAASRAAGVAMNHAIGIKDAATGELGAMRGFYARTSGNRFARGLSAYGMYSSSSKGRAAGTAIAAGIAASAMGTGIAPRGHKGWGFWGGPVGGLTARAIYGRGDRR